ncbi:MAG: beta-lactamase family protein [Acidimicrobiia bacterium]|nr:beta-lactamase family protein [Acidimicrobiia bacterium]
MKRALFSAVARLSTMALLAAMLGSEAAIRAQTGGVAPTARMATIDAVLRQAVERGDVPGVVAVATSRSAVLYTGAFGKASVSNDLIMAPDTIFHIASMTKPVTSVAAMQLVEQGKIALDDPVSKRLKAFERVAVVRTFDEASGAYTVSPASTPITIRHLLTHTSGLGYGFTHPTVRDFKAKDGETFDVGPLISEPGTEWLYGTSTDWVGRLVETVSGKSLDAYFRDHIFRPLEMVDTGFNVPTESQGRLVNVWQRDDKGGLTEQPRQLPAPVTQYNGGGGLFSTAMDYTGFVRMFLGNSQDLGGGPNPGPRILSAASLAEMTRNHIGALNARALRTAQPARSRDFSFIRDGRDKWGLGFLIRTDAEPGLRSAGSVSWGGINNTYFWIDRTRGIGGVILMQLLPFADAKSLALAEAFERAVYSTAGGPGQ